MQQCIINLNDFWITSFYLWLFWLCQHVTCSFWRSKSLPVPSVLMDKNLSVLSSSIIMLMTVWFSLSGRRAQSKVHFSFAVSTQLSPGLWFPMWDVTRKTCLASPSMQCHQDTGVWRRDKGCFLVVDLRPTQCPAETWYPDSSWLAVSFVVSYLNWFVGE